MTLALCAEMLISAGLASDERRPCQVAGGAGQRQGCRIFGRMVTGLGGPADFMERYDGYLPRLA